MAPPAKMVPPRISSSSTLLYLRECFFFVFLHRLKKMPQSMPEYALTRNYLEMMVELPWSKSTTG